MADAIEDIASAYKDPKNPDQEKNPGFIKSTMQRTAPMVSMYARTQMMAASNNMMAMDRDKTTNPDKYQDQDGDGTPDLNPEQQKVYDDYKRQEAMSKGLMMGGAILGGMGR